MGLIKRDFKVYVETPWHKYMSEPLSMPGAIRYMFEQLKLCGAVDLGTKGNFVETTAYWLEAPVLKTYVVEVNIPYMKITIKKQSKGSFSQTQFKETIKFIKENYYG